jgi:hypothetical protein
MSQKPYHRPTLVRHGSLKALTQKKPNPGHPFS